MNFDESNKAIYLQIYDLICDSILRGDYREEERIPSVRECAAAMEVNSNTAMRTYERLQNKGYIYNKRGIGFFMAPGAKEKIMAERSEELMDKVLPPIFQRMIYLGITPEKLAEAYENYINSNK